MNITFFHSWEIEWCFLSAAEECDQLRSQCKTISSVQELDKNKIFLSQNYIFYRRIRDWEVLHERDMQ